MPNHVHLLIQPTNTDDLEFHQWVTMPNFGIAYNADRWGVFRGTMGRGYEWLDLGGGDGTPIVILL